MPKCEKCSVDAVLKVFSTFQYFYCEECKIEVKPPEKSKLNTNFEGKTKIPGAYAYTIDFKTY